MATYAIGDIQGCFQSFLNLLEACRFDPSSDRLWLAGDLVNRGPRSLETLRYVRSLGHAAVVVLGNHDLSLLMQAAGFGKRSKGDTIDEVLHAPDAKELLDWLRHRPLCHLENGFCMVHAGLVPQWSVTEARLLAKEVEAALTGGQWQECLAHLWGSEPACWDDDLHGWARVRMIVNGLTRLRFCTNEGVLDFKSKGTLDHIPVGYVPWFDVPWRKSQGDTVITGHWSALGLKVREDLLAIDTGCLWGGMLTAVRLEDRAIIQVPCATGESQALT